MAVALAVAVAVAVAVAEAVAVAVAVAVAAAVLTVATSAARRLQPPPYLFQVAACLEQGTFEPQHLGIMVWSFSTLKCKPTKLLEQIEAPPARLQPYAPRLPPCVHRACTPMCSILQPYVFEPAALRAQERALEQLGGFNTQNCANILQAST